MKSQRSRCRTTNTVRWCAFVDFSHSVCCCRRSCCSCCRCSQWKGWCRRLHFRRCHRLSRLNTRLSAGCDASNLHVRLSRLTLYGGLCHCGGRQSVTRGRHFDLVIPRCGRLGCLGGGGCVSLLVLHALLILWLLLRYKFTGLRERDAGAVRPLQEVPIRRLV